MRALHFAQAVFWFEAEFVSDQKEQEIVPVAMDLHYAREVPHLHRLLDPAHLSPEAALPLPEARRSSVAAVYPLARDQVLRSIAALASVRSRELTERVELQIGRMTQYYADLRAELEDQGRRSRDKEEALARLDERRQALTREEQIRVAELRQKSSLRVSLRLQQLLLVQQPKLLLQARIASPDDGAGRVELVWDPFVEGLEAVLSRMPASELCPRADPAGTGGVSGLPGPPAGALAPTLNVLAFWCALANG